MKVVEFIKKLKEYKEKELYLQGNEYDGEDSRFDISDIYFHDNNVYLDEGYGRSFRSCEKILNYLKENNAENFTGDIRIINHQDMMVSSLWTDSISVYLDEDDEGEVVCIWVDDADEELPDDFDW